MNKKYISLALAALLLTACGSSDSKSSANDGEGSIDLSKYYPSKSMTKTFISTERDGDDVSKSHNNEIINVDGNTTTTTIDTKVIEKVVFSDKNITTTWIDDEETEVKSMFRYVDIGDVLFSKKTKFSENNDLGKISSLSTETCKIKSQEKRFEQGDNLYTGDLLKIECIAEGEVIYEVKQTILDAGAATDLNGSHDVYDTSYVYLQKGLGEVAYINDDCIPNEKLPMVINDRNKKCSKKQYDYEFYLP